MNRLDRNEPLNIKTPFAQTPVIFFFPMEDNTKPEVVTVAPEPAGTNIFLFSNS